MSLLKVENISSGYGKKQVLYDVSFSVNSGEIVQLKGGNGSGKSTILKCICNQLNTWNGKINFENNSTLGLKPNEIIRNGIVYIPQKNNVFEELTIIENLEVSGSIYSNSERKSKIEKVLNELPVLDKFKKRTPFNLSGGEKQLLCFGMALMHSPKLILYDEPLAGLSEKNSHIILSLIKKLNEVGTSFLIVEHRINQSELFHKEIKLYLGKTIENGS